MRKLYAHLYLRTCHMTVTAHVTTYRHDHDSVHTAEQQVSAAQLNLR